MIANSTIQFALISRGKGATTITQALGTSGQIKEAQWQGKDFIYPALRLVVGKQEQGQTNPNCSYGFLNFSWVMYSQEASSQEADNIAGIVNAHFHNSGFAYPGLLFNRIWSVGLIGAIRISEQLWRAENQYRAMITIR